MQLIAIDKSSIKKNKNAGSTQSHVFGVEEITFKTECTSKELEELKNNREIIISTWTHPKNDIVKVTGHVLNMRIMPALPGIWSIDCNNNIETIYHLPTPEYSYQFENTQIECDECKNLIPFREIGHDWEDDDVEFEYCPICKEIDTFEYEFQSIEEALKTK